MMHEIQGDVVKHLFRTKFGIQVMDSNDNIETDLSRAAESFDSSEKEAETEIKPIKNENKIGRNDPCPCGSGKKYKNCCGK